MARNRLIRAAAVLVAATGLTIYLLGCASSRPYVASRFQGWDTLAPPPDTALAYRAFLLGDTGSPPVDAPSPLLSLLKRRLDAQGPDAAVVFLGDNLYCCGLPDSSDPARPEAEARLRVQFDAVRAFEGHIVFVPGNHDWNDSRAGGLETLNRQEAFIEANLNRPDAFLPDDGFPGPVAVELTDNLVLIAIDTEWWLTDHDKPFGDTGAYELEEPGDFLLELDDLLEHYHDADVLVVGHHPIRSNGPHAGHVSPRIHLFPLTEVIPYAYIPLPVIGSLIPLYIRYFGASRQDLGDRRYASLRKSLDHAFSKHPSLIYAAGHEHSLQYFPDAFYHSVVSGTGSHSTYVAPGRGAAFTHDAEGFATLSYYRDGSIWLDMWTPDEASDDGRLLFRTALRPPDPGAEPTPADEPANDEGTPVDTGTPDTGNENIRDEKTSALLRTNPPPPREMPDYRDSVRVVAANPAYDAGWLHRFMLGAHNRDIWATPVRAPYLDMGHFAGGLTPVKRGGGMQTYSLRLRGADGREYALRSIDKDPAVSIPVNLRTTVATQIIQDQISSIHPFGAFMIPPLAEAAGIYHASPQLVWVPDDPRLGPFEDGFARQLMMIEVRPDEDMSDYPNFGHSTDVVSAHTFYRNLNDDNDHRLDVEAFVRARLFDMLISDWDRHRLQWRWATFEPHELDATLKGDARTRGKIYRPVPKDRDWAFNRMNGVFPSLVAAFIDPKFQDFEPDYGSLKGLTRNGLEQDRRLTAGVDKDTWLRIAEDLQHNLTDEVIQEAVHELPDTVFAEQGQTLIDILKARRERLPDVAASYYHILAKHVDLVGSNKHERFEVWREADGVSRVVVYKTNREGEVQTELLRRTFLPEETDEIRLFGLAGDDVFELRGDADRAIPIRAVGGTGADTFIDRSTVQRGGTKAHFYDSPNLTEIQANTGARITLSDDPAVNAYDPNAYKHDATLPQLFLGRNPDDGLFLGGGVRLVRHGFRKDPYAVVHRMLGNVSVRTGAFNVVYEGHYVDVFGPVDLNLETSYRSPNNIRNYYGLGNETENTSAFAEFYQARLTQGRVDLRFQLADGSGTSITIGPKIDYTNVRKEADRFVGQAGIDPSSFEDQWYLGLAGGLVLDFTDHPVNPRQGLKWVNDVDFNLEASDLSMGNLDGYSKLESAMAFYVPVSRIPQLTWASRIGLAHNIGTFPFFDANTLGGENNLRGWRSTRFAGRTSLFVNTELRLALYRFSNFLAMGQAGVLGFTDLGRVWTDGESSRRWHSGYGGGAWVSLFDLAVLSGTVGFSREEANFILQLGFQF